MNGKVYFINDKTFDREVLKETSPVLVNYWANWCDPCQKISLALERIAQSYASHIKVTKLDTDESPKILAKYGIQNVPTLMLFRNGKVIATKVETLSREQLITFIEGNILRAWPFY